jgi:hypothetical protein
MVKYTYVNAPEDDEPELMPTSSFLQLIDPGNGGVASNATGARLSTGKPADVDPVKTQLLEIAVDYVGIVAEMIVDEAFEEDRTVGEAIDYVCSAIPDQNQARAFRKAALEHFSSIDI